MPKKTKKLLSYYSPARIITCSFLLVILTGAFLLTLPISSKAGEFTPFVDALFTATSATCVTGLVIYDTYTHWSIFGQMVLICLIQIGGLGLVTFAAFFNLLAGRKMGIRSMQLFKESINSESVANVHRMVQMVILYSVSIEAIGAIIISTQTVPKYGGYGLFMAVFLAISAFCNAGFDLCGMEGEFISLCGYSGNYVMLITISLLIIAGGLGFIVWNNLIEFRRSKRLLLHTRVVLVMTALLIGFGTLGFLIYEWNNPATMGGLSPGEKILAAYFQSVSARTAGFNSIPLNSLHDVSKSLSIFLMFIGAAPGSTGGGIKVTTMAVILMTVLSMAKGREEATIANRRLSPQTVYKSMTILVCGVFLVCVTTGVLLSTSPVEASGMSMLDAVYESTSAFSTTGLSVGPTSVASTASKLMLSLTMYLGRVGPISFMLAVATPNPLGRREIIPEGKIMVG